MRTAIVALMFAACTTTMHFRVIDKGAYGPDAPKPSVAVEKGEKESVIHLNLGTRPTGGWSIEPLEVLSEGDALTVKAKVNAPQAGGIVTQVFTAPYAVIAVDAHPAAVRWVDENGNLIAEWK